MVFLVRALITLVLIISLINLSLTAGKDNEDTQEEVLETVQDSTNSIPSQHNGQSEDEKTESSEPIVYMKPQEISDDFCLSGSISELGLVALNQIKTSARDLKKKENQLNRYDSTVIDIILEGLTDSSIFILSRIGGNSEQIENYKMDALGLIEDIERILNDIAKTRVTKLNFIESMELIRGSDIWPLVTYICWHISPNSELWLNIMNLDEKIDSIYRFIRYVFGNRVFVLFVANVGPCMRTYPECLNEIQHRVFELRSDRVISAKLNEPSSIRNLIYLLSVLYDKIFHSCQHVIHDFCSKIAFALVTHEKDNILNNDELAKKMISILKSDGYSEASLHSFIKGLNEFKRLREHSAAV